MEKEYLDRMGPAHFRADLLLKSQVAVRRENYNKLPHAVGLPLNLGEKVRYRYLYSVRANIQDVFSSEIYLVETARTLSVGPYIVRKVTRDNTEFGKTGSEL